MPAMVNSIKQVFQNNCRQILCKSYGMNPLAIAVVVTCLFSFHDPDRFDEKYSLNDTTIHHVLDGKENEWPAEKFQTDPATQFRYAIDNDKQNLYLVLAIANFREQMKIMRQGMDLYFDLKEKKKEGKGIEFPVKETSPLLISS